MDRGKHAPGGRVVTLESIPKIVEMQHRFARETSCGFLNMLAAMGGEGTMARWHTGKNHLVGGDLTHPTAWGANRRCDFVWRFDGWLRAISRARGEPICDDFEEEMIIESAALPPDVRKAYGFQLPDLSTHWGYAPTPGRARREIKSSLPEGQRPSAHQAAKPKTKSTRGHS